MIYTGLPYIVITATRTVLRLLAIGLELPEDTFVEQFGFDAESDT